MFEQIDIINLMIELTVGRLILALPKEDLKKINKMLKEHFGNAKIQEEDN